MHPGLITIDDQIAAMAVRWPDLMVVERSARRAVWEGSLRPQKTWYRVRIAYEVPLAPEYFRVIAVQPRVQVIPFWSGTWIMRKGQRRTSISTGKSRACRIFASSIPTIRSGPQRIC